MMLAGMQDYGNKVELWAKDADAIGIADRYMEQFAEDKDPGSMTWRCWQIGGYCCGNITRQALWNVANVEMLPMPVVNFRSGFLRGGFPGADAPSIGTDRTVYVKE